MIVPLFGAKETDRKPVLSLCPKVAYHSDTTERSLNRTKSHLGHLIIANFSGTWSISIILSVVRMDLYWVLKQPTKVLTGRNLLLPQS